MPDTVRSIPELTALLVNNAQRLISAQDVRDAFVSTWAMQGVDIFVPRLGADVDRSVAISAAYVLAYSRYLATGRVQVVQLEAGSYACATPIVAKDFVWLRGAGEGVTTLLWTGPLGSLTDESNALLKAQGALNTKLGAGGVNLTNVAAGGAGSPYYPSGSPMVSVDGVGTLALLDWVIIRGHNNAAYPEYFSSPGSTLVWTDLLQVQTIDGLELHFNSHTASYHTVDNGGVGTPKKVIGVTPIQGVRVSDLTIDGANIPVGILFEYAYDFRVERVGFTRISRAGILGRSSRNVVVSDNYLGGALNGHWRFDSVHDYTVRLTRSTDKGERYCSVGHGYGWGSLINNCCYGRIFDNTISHFGIGLNVTGARNTVCNDNTYRDLDSELYQTRDASIEFSSEFTLGTIGLGVHLGCVSLNIAEFNQGFVDRGTTIIDAQHAQFAFDAGVADDCSYWNHDTVNMIVDGLGLYNGKSPYQNIDGVVRGMTGIRGHDANGWFTNVQIRGCEFAVRVNAGGFEMQTVNVTSHANQGTIPSFALWLHAGSGVIGMVTLNDCSFSSVWFDSTFGATDYGLFVMRRLTFNDKWYEGPLYAGKNTTGVVVEGGSVVALRDDGTTYERNLVLGNHANAGQLARVAAGPGGFGAQNNAHCLFELLPSTRGSFVCKTADEVRMGALLKWEGGTSLQVTPLGAGATVATALGYKAAATPGHVLAGQVGIAA